MDDANSILGATVTDISAGINAQYGQPAGKPVVNAVVDFDDDDSDFEMYEIRKAT